jgi:hypothetical protein
LFFALIPTIGRAQTVKQSKPAGANPIPEPAIPAILATFDKYEVVGIDAAHRMKDVDDFILTLALSSPEACKDRWKTLSMPSSTSVLKI